MLKKLCTGIAVFMAAILAQGANIIEKDLMVITEASSVSVGDTLRAKCILENNQYWTIPFKGELRVEMLPGTLEYRVLSRDLWDHDYEHRLIRKPYMRLKPTRVSTYFICLCEEECKLKVFMNQVGYLDLISEFPLEETELKVMLGDEFVIVQNGDNYITIKL